MATTTYTVTIQMSTATVQDLLKEGSALVAFSAVQGTDAAALPLVWCVENTFGNDALLQWQTSYSAYASDTPIVAGTIVQIATSQQIALGQILAVSNGPTSVVDNGGTAGTITITNTTTSQFTCGIEQNVNQVLSPVCVYPLYGGNIQTITPLPQIVLLFTTAPVVVGEAFSGSTLSAAAVSPKVMLDAVSTALSIDMAQAPGTSVTVGYDVNNGWSWAGGSWGMTILTSQLVSTLIQPNPPPTLALPRKKEKS